VIIIGVSGAVCDVARAVSCKHLTNEAEGKSHGRPCRVCDENGDRDCRECWPNVKADLCSYNNLGSHSGCFASNGVLVCEGKIGIDRHLTRGSDENYEKPTVGVIRFGI
jgi:hypothetical protein